MIDWTDRHCRYFHRQLMTRARLYTEMIVDQAILRGDKEYLLGFDECEHPVALQLGGSDPTLLVEAARIGEQFGYDEINLNVGCPSDRVQSGAFGACLMLQPQLVADCWKAMADAVSVPVTVKCRIGVDDQVPEESLYDFVDTVAAAGCDVFIIHARKAWLQGLSPKENRTIPPLDYPLVANLKQARPELTIALNGGVLTLAETLSHLQSFDGVMMGRAAYENPYQLADVDNMVFGESMLPVSRRQVAEAMATYVDRQVAAGVPAHAVTRHMLGLFHGQPGARFWRRHLTTEAIKKDATGDVLREALAGLPEAAFVSAA
jgi:tRNA-dihydrouridine synthase A